MAINVGSVDPKLAVALIGGACGIISTLIPIADKWIRDHTSREKVTEELDMLTRRVTFLDSWFKTAQLVNDADRLEEIKATLRQQLLQLAQLYAAQSMPTSKIASTEAQRIPDSAIRRALLFYRPSRSAAWIPRIFFYGSTGYVVGVFLALPMNGGLRDPLVWVLIFVLLSLAWVFRYLSVRMQSADRPDLSPTN